MRDGETAGELGRLIGAEIAAKGAMTFADFMGMALYHPELGYYARGTGQTGRMGDFFTSVSVGPLFGRLLARRFRRWWVEAGEPERWRIVEVGAHDGWLAGDVLGELERTWPEAWKGVEYVIVEPLARLRRAQAERLAGLAGRVEIRETAAGLERRPGVVFGNEVLDALPFRVIEKRGGRWMECRVGEGLGWVLAEAGEALAPQVLREGAAGYAEGYRTEVRDFTGFLEPLTAALDHGRFIFPDYGFAEPEYYHPGRTEGTLRTFSRHRAGENPLAAPGEADITAHVDFTALARAAEGLGLRVAAFESQGSWLTAEAREWLLEQEGRPDAEGLRQFGTLTHPGQLGGRFQVIELAWNEVGAATLPVVAAHRLGM